MYLIVLLSIIIRLSLSFLYQSGLLSEFPGNADGTLSTIKKDHIVFIVINCITEAVLCKLISIPKSWKQIAAWEARRHSDKSKALQQSLKNGHW